MSDYRRARDPGGTYYFTVVTHEWRSLFHTVPARQLLRAAASAVRQELPFAVDGFVLLHDHPHAMWTLPPGDSDYSKRWGQIKKAFTQSFIAAGGTDTAVSASKAAHRRRGVWQRRFWEHVIRDERDYNVHLDYIRFNPVKHGHATCPHAWPFSSFGRHVGLSNYAWDWSCGWHDRPFEVPDFSMLPTGDIE